MNLEILGDPTFSIALTLGAYMLAMPLHRLLPQIHGFIWATALVLLVLLPLPCPGGLEAKLKAYRAGGDMITFMLGPATVALAVPLYKNAPLIRRHAWPILAAVICGGLTAMLSGAGLAYAFCGGGELFHAILPKSVTTPIAVSLVTPFGKSFDMAHLQSLTAALVGVAGVFGAMAGPRVLRWIGVRNEMAAGLAMGAASHGIGTATAFKHSETRGASSGLAMALNGVLTSLLMIPVYLWLS